MKNINLKSFQYIGSEKGWNSPLIEFGDAITAFEGPNGSGKTPIMNGIAYCLGFAVQLPQDILDNCSRAELCLSINNRELTFRRRLNEEHFNIEIFENGSLVEQFKGYGSAGEYSRYFLNLVEIRDIPIMSIGSKEKRSPTSIYISTLIPIFYLTQSKGFAAHYSPLDKQSFILNQYEEVIRAILSLPALSPASAEEEKDAFYKKRDKIKTIINELDKKVDFFKQQLGKKLGLSLAEIELLRDQFSQRVEELQHGLLIAGAGSNTLVTDEINHVRQELHLTNGNISQAKFKLKGLESLRDDIYKKIEVEEDAFDAEVAFQNFCTHTECSLFTNKKVPFGKKLLYLKDQLKDIEKTISQYNKEIDLLTVKRDSLKAKVEAMITKPQEEGTGVSRNIELLKESITSLTEYTEALKNKEALNIYSAELTTQKDELFQVTETIQLFRGKGTRISERHADIRSTFEGLLKEWLNTVSTPNIRKHPITVDDNFNLYFRDKIFEADSEQDGSTRVRIILAYHAALLETSLKFNENHPPLIMIDTPKKEEIEMKDLIAYFKRMRELKDAYKRKVQIIIAYKDPFLDMTEGLDKTFTPTFDAIDEDGKPVKKYLGGKTANA